MIKFQGRGSGNNTSATSFSEEEEERSMKKNIEMDGGDWFNNNNIISGEIYKKTEDASQKHAFAERKRRKKINDHYNSLRHLFPHLPKTDKATLLTEAVRRVKELKKMVAELAINDAGECCGVGGATVTSPYFFPGEDDEATVGYCCDGGDGKTVKATICCDDRPSLNRDLTEAVRSVRGRVVRAEMSTIGGRTKAVVVVWWPERGGGGGGGGGEEDVVSLRKALKAVVENRALGSAGNIGLMGRILKNSKWAGSGPEIESGKRARFYNSNGDGLTDGLLLSCI